jgi:hypothetical protein
MTDFESLILVGTALFGCGAVVQHFYDRYAAKGLYNRTGTQAAAIREELHALPPAIGSELESALNRVAAQQEANLGSATDDVQQAQDALMASLARIEGAVVALPTAFGTELRKLAEEQKAELIAEARAAEAQVQGTLKGAEMSMVRAVGVDRAMRARVDHALSEAILGPALPILRQFAPGLADTLEENPQLVDVLIEHPLFRKYVEPRIASLLGKAGGSDVVNPGWGP